MTTTIQEHVLVLGPQPDIYLNLLKATCKNLHLDWQIEDKDAFLAEYGDSIKAIATNGVLGASKEVIDRFPSLKIIASSSVGYDAIDVAYAKSKGIWVTTTPDVLNDCVADTGILLMMAVARKLVNADRFTRSGQWHDDFPLTNSLAHKTCGIVGMGKIGTEVARRAEALKMEIAYTNQQDKHIPQYRYVEDIVQLAEQSDFLVLTLPSIPSTYHIVNAEVLTHLGKNGYLINIARGAVVDEKALIAALQQHIIAGAGLDVYEKEPMTSSPLFELDNVTLTPHYASATVETRRAMAQLVCDNLIACFTEQKVLTNVY